MPEPSSLAGDGKGRSRRYVIAAKSFLGCDVSTNCPEGQGVNVFATARLAGLRFDKTRRIGIVHKIALVGHSPERNNDECRMMNADL